MKTVTISEPFEGYPDGAEEGSMPATYTAGQVVDVPDEFADLIVGRGLATEGGEKLVPVTPAAEPATTEETHA